MPTRTKLICSLVATMLLAFTLASTSASAKEGELPPIAKKGMAAPELTFTDILGVESGNAAYPEHVQIVSFATQETSEALMGWMSSLTKDISKNYPKMSMVYFSFADLTEVPSLLRPIARPILENMIGSEIEPMRQRFKAEPAAPGLPAPEAPEFHLIPDWDGGFLQKFGFETLEGFHCWVIHKGRVMGHFTPTTPNKDEAFIALFKKLQADGEADRKVAVPSATPESSNSRGM